MQPPLMLAWMSSEPCSEAARATTFGTAPNIAHASAVFKCGSPYIDLAPSGQMVSTEQRQRHVFKMRFAQQ